MQQYTYLLKLAVINLKQMVIIKTNSVEDIINTFWKN